MFYEKRYLQFNNLVFDGYDMISETSEPVRYKTNSTAYSYGHGSYMPLKADYMFVEERSVSMTITLKMKKLPCEYREYYARFSEQELGRPGRLWAIRNNEIIWAFAIPTNLRVVTHNRQDEVVWDIEFAIPSGVWTKADKLKTFVLPYDVCTFMECKEFKTINPCEDVNPTGDCCLDCQINKALEKANYDERCFCCCVDTICPDMALCYYTDRLQEFYSCDTPFQLVYDCEKAEQFSDKPLGQKLCTKDACSNIIAGRFYSETDIPSTEVSIEIVGTMKNPAITINGNTNVIKGEYEHLKVDADGSVYEITECCMNLKSPSVWEVSANMNYGWTIYPQENSIIVDLGSCCTRSCVFIQHNALTT